MVVGRLFLAVPRGCLQFVIVVFPDHTHLLFLLCLCARLFVCAWWSPAGGGGGGRGGGEAGLWLLFVVSTVSVCHFPIGILGQVWYLIVSDPDLCTLTYFVQILLICIQQ